jgi:hypothetical protein
MFEDLRALFHLDTVIQSLSKDALLPEAALFDRFRREPSRTAQSACLAN